MQGVGRSGEEKSSSIGSCTGEEQVSPHYVLLLRSIRSR